MTLVFLGWMKMSSSDLVSGPKRASMAASSDSICSSRRRADARRRFTPGELCCDIERFSLHAKVRLAAHDRDGLERLCRYVARPPFRADRLSLDDAGRVVYALRRRWRVVAVCIEVQIVDEVPTEAHDARVDAVATERGIYEPRTK